jgi:hypothetical protein
MGIDRLHIGNIALLALLASAFVLVFILPVAISALLYWVNRPVGNWRMADRSSAGLLPAATAGTGAIVRIFSARTVRWRGIVATHSWIVIKEAGAAAYSRFDYTAWGEPIWVDRFVPDGRWFGRAPDVVFAADGPAAERIIPRIRQGVRDFPFREVGDYRAWPGPNSNTFVAAIMSAVPGLCATLPPTAIGKDFPVNGRWIGRSPSGTGLHLSLGGYAGLAIGWIEGIEFNLLGAVAGLDLRRPALKLPGLGRVGYAEAAAFFNGVRRKSRGYAFIAAALRRWREGLRGRIRGIPARTGHAAVSDARSVALRAGNLKRPAIDRQGPGTMR